jgi:hypothetical protein
MVKTVSVAQLGHGGASRAVREAQDGPVLVSKENRPAAWLVSARDVVAVAEARGVEPDVYQRALDLLAVDLYAREVLTLGQASRLAGISLGDFIDLCSKLRVPILWEPKGGLAADVDAFDALLDDTDTTPES